MKAQPSIPSFHLLVSDLYPGDAIGNFVLAVRDMLVRRGFCATLYAERHHASFADVLPYKIFFANARSSDVLFYQLSNHDPALRAIMATPCRKVVYYHNITPGSFFAPYSPDTAVLLDKGRTELPLVKKADALLANSDYSMAEVEPYLAPKVPRGFFPPFLRGQLVGLDLPVISPLPLQSPYLLTLGRVVPHKRVENALRIFSALHEKIPDLRLVVAGAQYEPYVAILHNVLEDLPEIVPHVSFTGMISRNEVEAYLHNSAGLLHASAHEGFCMPILEAMLAGVPVFAHQQTAVAETLNGTGILFDAENSQEAAGRILDEYFNFPMQQHKLSAQSRRAQSLCELADENILLDVLLGRKVGKRFVVSSPLCTGLGPISGGINCDY